MVAGIGNEHNRPQSDIPDDFRKVSDCSNIAVHAW